MQGFLKVHLGASFVSLASEDQFGYIAGISTIVILWECINLIISLSHAEKNTNIFTLDNLVLGRWEF